MKAEISHLPLMENAKKVTQSANSVLNDFKNFIAKGNVVDLAIGLVIGAAFTGMVNSFVADIISPILGLMFQVNLGNNYLILRCPEDISKAGNCSVSNYATPALANEVGIVSWNYGNFLQVAINFIMTAGALFFIIKAYSAAFRRKKSDPSTKECKYCTKEIPIKATRCPECTSGVDLDFNHESLHME